jgi:hypothetical protein
MVLAAQSSKVVISAMRGNNNSRNYLEGRNNGCHQNQLNGGLKSLVIDENEISSPIRNVDGKLVNMQKRNGGLGSINHQKSKDPKYGFSNQKLTQSLDFSSNMRTNQFPNHSKDNFRNQSNMRRGADESKTQRDITRWSHDQSNYPYHANQRSQFSFELNEFDEEICKRTATRAYTTQISLECDMEVAQCVHLTAMAHDRALFEHAQCVNSHVANAKQVAISEWLKSKSKEEQLQYLSHHNPPSISVPGKL